MSLATLDPRIDDRMSPEFMRLWTRAAKVVNEDEPAKETQPATASRHRHLLGLRFLVTNLAAFALIATAATQGWVTTVINGDETRLTLVIFGAFVVGLFTAAWKIWQLGHALNAAEAPELGKVDWILRYVQQGAGKDAGARAIAGSALRLQLANKIGFVKHVANSLVLLGLIGTVIGFIIALSGVDAQTAADPNAIAPMVGDLIRGMSVALYTTLAGAVFNLWLMINFHMLTGGATRLAGRLIEAAEDSALEADNDRA